MARPQLTFKVWTDPGGDVLRIAFPQSVRWLGFTLEDARQFRALLDQQIREMEKKKRGGDR